MTTFEDLLQQLCHDLRALWTEAGGPSLRVLAMQAGLGKSQVSAILNGRIRRPPDWDVVKSLIDGFLRYANDHGRTTRLSLRTGIEEYWRPRYSVLEHAFRQESGHRPSAGQGTKRAAPRQLPAGVTHFAGRLRELAALSRLLERDAGEPGTVVISAIGGTAGVGKTALAVHWAHQVRERFPDGQLYVNLRGFDPADSILEPAVAIRRFLQALGVPPERFPAELDDLAALYRSELAGRRMLIVLDNARNSAQVRPLLPGAGSCLVLVTSRNQLSGLVSTHGADVIGLDLPSAEEARELLAHRLGPERLLAEAKAADEIISRSAQLPLALSIVAARAASNPHLPLQALAGELSETDHRLNALTTDDPTTDVRTVFSWSYDSLTPDAAALFRLLGLHPGPDVTAPAAASLTALDLSLTRRLLTELIQANLLVEHAAGRYVVHDLLRSYAWERAHAVDSDEQRREARERMLNYYLHATATASRLVFAPGSGGPLPPLRPGVTSTAFTDRRQALDWFTVEQIVLLAVHRQAISAGLHAFVCQFAQGLASFQFNLGYWHDDVPVQRAAIAAARRIVDPEAEMNAHFGLAIGYMRLGRLDDAEAHYQECLAMSVRAEDHARQIKIECNLGGLRETQGRYAESLEHLRRATHLCEVTGDKMWLARALIGIAEIHAQDGDHQLALTTLQRALSLQLELEDTLGLARTHHYIGYMHYRLNRHQTAMESYLRSLELNREVGCRYEEAKTLTCMGDTHYAMGDGGAARVAWMDALTILEAVHHADAEPVRAKLAAVDDRYALRLDAALDGVRSSAC